MLDFLLIFPLFSTFSFSTFGSDIDLDDLVVDKSNNVSEWARNGVFVNFFDVSTIQELGPYAAPVL